MRFQNRTQMPVPKEFILGGLVVAAGEEVVEAEDSEDLAAGPLAAAVPVVLGKSVQLPHQRCCSSILFVHLTESKAHSQNLLRLASKAI